MINISKEKIQERKKKFTKRLIFAVKSGKYKLISAANVF